MKNNPKGNINTDSFWNNESDLPYFSADNNDVLFGSSRRSIQPHQPSLVRPPGRPRRRRTSSQQQQRLLPTHASRTALLEIPLRYNSSTTSDGKNGNGGTLVMAQTNQMAISSVMPLLMLLDHGGGSHSWWLRLNATTAMRGKTGFSTVQTGVQYNFATPTTTTTTTTNNSNNNNRSSSSSSRHWMMPTVATPTTLNAGVILGEQAPAVYLGGSCLVSSQRRHSSISTQVQIPPTQPQKARLSFSSRHAIMDTYYLATSCSIAHNNTAMVQLHLASHRTGHTWNVGLAWNFHGHSSTSSHSRSSFYPTLSFQLAPRLSLWHRHISCMVSTNGRWGGTITTTCGSAKQQQQQSSHTTAASAATSTSNKQAATTTPVTKFSIGVHRILQQGGLVWTFSFTQGEFTLRIPVTIATAAVKDNAAIMSWWNTPSWQLAYISLLSHILHDMLADILQLNNSNGGATNNSNAIQQQQQEEQWLRARDKARHDATLQQQFMAKQAKIRTDAEREVAGLVITRALYYYTNNFQDNNTDESSTSSSSSSSSSLDVTIPLQFWVADSSLQLPASSKANMLGFYNVASVLSTTTTTTPSTPPSLLKLSSSSSYTFWNRTLEWLSGLWTVDTSRTNHLASLVASNVQLTVQYDYAGRSYEITILDQEELYLPSPKARLVGRHPKPVAE